eukprot:8966987-Karenia_brevis.AAC.1
MQCRDTLRIYIPNMQSNMELRDAIQICKSDICAADMQICDSDMRIRYALRICTSNNQFRNANQICKSTMQFRYAMQAYEFGDAVPRVQKSMQGEGGVAGQV